MGGPATARTQGCRAKATRRAPERTTSEVAQYSNRRSGGVIHEKENEGSRDDLPEEARLLFQGDFAKANRLLDRPKPPQTDLSRKQEADLTGGSRTSREGPSSVERPPRAEPFRPKHKGSLPALEKVRAEEVEFPEFPPSLAETPPRVLPGLELHPTVGCPSWLINLYDATGGEKMRQGRGAPWSMRLFVGALLHLPIEKRDGEWHRLPFRTEEVIRWLHPQGWPHRARDWERFPEALERMKQYGKDSAVLYRAYLSVSAFRSRSARRGNAITREIGAPMWDEQGRNQRRKGGGLRRSRESLVDNPAAKYVKDLSDRDLTSMIGLDPDDKRYRLKARKAFERLHEDGVIDLQKEGKFSDFRAVGRVGGRGPNPSPKRIRNPLFPYPYPYPES